MSSVALMTAELALPLLLVASMIISFVPARIPAANVETWRLKTDGNLCNRVTANFLLRLSNVRYSVPI